MTSYVTDQFFFRPSRNVNKLSITSGTPSKLTPFWILKKSNMCVYVSNTDDADYPDCFILVLWFLFSVCISLPVIQCSNIFSPAKGLLATAARDNINKYYMPTTVTAVDWWKEDRFAMLTANLAINHELIARKVRA